MALINDPSWESFRGPVLADYFYGLLPTTTPSAPTTGSTIATASVTSARLNPAGAITGVIMAVGTYDGQPYEARNISANSITMAASGTSHVADGTGCVIAAYTICVFKWDATSSLWMHNGL